MKQKTPSVKKKSSAKSAKAPAKAKASWADTMKKALENKQQRPGSWPDQPKPRDSHAQKGRKNAF